MTKKQFFALIAAVAMVWVGTLAVAPAGATPTSTASPGVHAVQTGVVRIDPQNAGVAYVSGRYLCPSGDAALWISAKQMADGRPDPALKQEGSSAIAAAWLERHPAPDEFTCDGTWHTGTWMIDSVTEYGFGQLVPGQVYLQFCWTGPETAPEQPAWYAFDEQFAAAR